MDHAGVLPVMAKSVSGEFEGGLKNHLVAFVAPGSCSLQASGAPIAGTTVGGPRNAVVRSSVLSPRWKISFFWPKFTPRLL